MKLTDYFPSFGATADTVSQSNNNAPRSLTENSGNVGFDGQSVL